MKKWITEGSEIVGSYRIFTVRKQRNRSPRTGKGGDFFVMDCPPWVNVIALTPDDRVVLVEQYRHGTDEVTWEIPGGCVDPSDESPLAAARRELAEETGYEGDEWVALGVNAPNPAINSNRCHTYLVRNATLKREQRLDGMEEIDVHLVPVKEVGELIRKGRINHSLVITGFYFYELWLRNRGSSGRRGTS